MRNSKNEMADLRAKFHTLWDIPEIKPERLAFIHFLKNRKALVALTALFALLCYGCLLMYFRISVDNELMLCNYGGSLDWHLELGRPSNVVFKWIFDYQRFNIYFAALVTIVNIAAFALFWCFMFYSEIGDRASRRIFWIFPILLLSYPTLAEQFAFLMQGVEVSLAIFGCGAAIYLLNKALLHKGGKGYYFGAVFILSVCLGSYQAIASLFIAGAAAYYMLWYFYGSSESIKSHIKIIALYILAFVAAMGIYYLIASFFKAAVLSGVQQNQYVDDQLMWTADNIAQRIKIIASYIKSITISGDVFANALYFPTAVILFVINIFKLIRKRDRLINCILALLATALFVISPNNGQRYTAYEYSKKMPSWPKEGSVADVDGLIVVKLSEPSERFVAELKESLNK